MSRVWRVTGYHTRAGSEVVKRIEADTRDEAVGAFLMRCLQTSLIKDITAEPLEDWEARRPRDARGVLIALGQRVYIMALDQIGTVTHIGDEQVTVQFGIGTYADQHDYFWCNAAELEVQK